MLTMVGGTDAVSTHSRPKAAGVAIAATVTREQFQHTAARRRLAKEAKELASQPGFNTQPPEGGWARSCFTDGGIGMVSTHSRPKAAGGAVWFWTNWIRPFQHTAARRRLENCPLWRCEAVRFQHTAARRRLALYCLRHQPSKNVSTHSRPKAAGHPAGRRYRQRRRFNTQPPEGGWVKSETQRINKSRFNTQPPEGGWECLKRKDGSLPGFNTQPPEGGWVFRLMLYRANYGFNTQPPEGGWAHNRLLFDCRRPVSTHSRPKAAGWRCWLCRTRCRSFNTQPPEGGWHYGQERQTVAGCFNTQPPEGGWDMAAQVSGITAVSTHSRPKAAGHKIQETRLNQ